jgi:pimeloyl-ACP methyl ester carboxylesterase
MRLVPLGVLCLIGLVWAAEPGAFAERYAKTKNSWERRELVEGLDASDAASRRALVKILARAPWYQREGAVSAHAKLSDEAVWAKLVRERKAPVLEGVARALGRSKAAGRLTHLRALVGHKHWQVRRAAVIALRRVLAVEAIDALVGAWEKEKDFRVWIHCLESLEHLTGETDLATLQGWKSWLEAKRDSLDLGQKKRRPVTGGGKAIRTRVRGTSLDLRTRGRGNPLLVLPEYGYEHFYLQTYLRDLEDQNQILYLKLPGAVDFNPALEKAPGLPDPYYPIGRLVRSLEALHDQLVSEKKIRNKPFSILAHGLTCWIAMRYALAHPKKVRRLILIAPYSGGEAWDAGRVRVEALGRKLGDEEMVHFAQNQLYDGYETKSDAEGEAIERKEFSCYFADSRDLEIGRLWGPVVTKTEKGESYDSRWIQRPLGTVVIPEFELSKLKRPSSGVRTLVLHGARSTRTSGQDASAVAKFFGGKVLAFKSSARMPFYEEHDRFTKSVRKFLR